MSTTAQRFDALLFLSFGGPDGPEDVMPFLENVTRGRGVPPERLEAVAQHYLHFGGVSPINRLNLEMIDSLRSALAHRVRDLPVYFGNRNWHPMVSDTLAQMYREGHRRILVFPTSAWAGYSGCRQYHEDIARAVAALAEAEPTSVGDPVLLRKLPQYWDEPAFVAAGADAVRRAQASLPNGSSVPRLVFTAHSVPLSADRAAGPAADGGGLYSKQVHAAAAAVAAAAGFEQFDQVWQSRSGPPQVPWLEPDICDHLESIATQGVRQVIVAPVGFVSDHLEVIWDLDNEAAETAARLGMDFVRADTVGTDHAFVEMIVDLIDRYVDGDGDLSAMGCGDNGQTCRPDCCIPARPQSRPRR
ncbi:ferrochelatase [Gordonia rhizosphera]|uniref:Coproporphyrin III ferrochelatase n=1 Tax=Gordonia rhizosphera NBRC 16068 TaxID=1108045 RepID=K6X3Y0_9ACTN|nr:ferrochelatase [Gordonia rhizosphera]GAB93519.1 ferrochelatase [Gordonia rhizosphera NBRC 16068]